MPFKKLLEKVFENTFQVKVSDGTGVEKDIYNELTLPEINVLLMSKQIINIHIIIGVE